MLLRAGEEPLLLPSSTRSRAASEGGSSTYESLQSLPSHQSGGFVEELQLERMAAAGLRHKLHEAEAEVRAAAAEGLQWACCVQGFHSFGC